MSKRGRQLFDHYIRTRLNDPHLVAIGLGSHAFSLSEAARAQKIPLTEVTEEVGPLYAALAASRK